MGDTNDDQYEELAEEQEVEEVEIVINPKKEKDALIQKPQFQTYFQQSKQQLSTKKKDAQDMVRTSIRKRSLCRIIIFILLLTIQFLSYFLIYKYRAFFKDHTFLLPNDKIHMKMTSCKVNISDLGTEDFNFEMQRYGSAAELYNDFISAKGQRNLQSLKNIPILMQYNIPGRFDYLGLPILKNRPHSTIKLPKNSSASEKNYTFRNYLSAESCQINLFVSEKVHLEQISFNCTQECFIFVNSKKLKTHDFNLTGNFLDINAINIKVDSFNSNSKAGRKQLNHIEFSKNISIVQESSDIIVQSSQNLFLSFVNSFPAYCIGSPYISNPQITGCQRPPESQIQSYLNQGFQAKAAKNNTNTANDSNSDETQKGLFYINDNLKTKKDSKSPHENYDDEYLDFLDKQMSKDTDPDSNDGEQEEKKTKELLPPSCWGSAYLCQDQDCTGLNELNNKKAGYVTLQNKFGQIYTNIIKEQGVILQKNATIFKSAEHYGNSGEQVLQWSLDTQRDLKEKLIAAANPKQVEPTFILEVGSKKTFSDDFMQWQVNYNPAYAYLKPWWMSTFSFTLMSSQLYDVRAHQNPGLCPFYPSLDLGDLFKTQLLIDATFENATRKIETLAWQAEFPLPKVKRQKKSDGMRQVTRSRAIGEEWVNFKLNSDNKLDTFQISLSENVITLVAVILSFSLAFIIALELILGVVYAIDFLYVFIVNHVANVDKYSNLDGQGQRRKDADQLLQEDDQQINENQKDSDDKSDDGKKKSEVKTGDISLQLSIAQLFRILYQLAPPISAFIDYLVNEIMKNYQNSAQLFYDHLFKIGQQSGDGDDIEVHDLQTESIRGQEIKTLYEKFCFLNGFLEQKLDDPSNLKLLDQKKFKIENRTDAMTECYSFVKFLPDMQMQLPPSALKDQKGSLTLFIEQCCIVTKFETDFLESDDFQSVYQEFCMLNHIQNEQASEIELKNTFGIQTGYKPQQWIPGQTDDTKKAQSTKQDEKPEGGGGVINVIIKIIGRLISAISTLLHKIPICDRLLKQMFPEKKPQIWYIDREKLQNHFLLLLDQPEKIREDKLGIAQSELILFRNWYLIDIMIVIAHFLGIIILGLPCLAILLLERVEYSPFSLVPEQFIITKEDIFYNIWILPEKFLFEEKWVQVTVASVLGFYIFAFFDLIVYYIGMQFPQENYFKKEKQRDDSSYSYLIQRFCRQLMWTIVLVSAFVALSYLILGLVWLVLGAIVSPSVFLPYATAASTFITVTLSKYREIKEVIDKGFTMVLDYVKNMADQQVNSMLKKMDLSTKVQSLVKSDTMKSIAGQAAKLGIVKQSTINEMEEKAVQLAKDPVKLANDATSELAAIAQDPQKFANDLLNQMEEKALQMIEERVQKNFGDDGRDIADHLINIMRGIYTKNLDEVKYELQGLFQTSVEMINKKQNEGPAKQIMQILANEKVTNLIFELAFPYNEKITMDIFMNVLLPPVGDFIHQMIIESINKKTNTAEKDKILKWIDQINLGDFFTKFYKIVHNIKTENRSGIVQTVNLMISEINLNDLNYIKPVIPVFSLSLSMFKENNSYKEMFTFSKEFLKSWVDQKLNQQSDLRQMQGASSGIVVEDDNSEQLSTLMSFFELILDSIRIENKHLKSSQIQQMIIDLMQQSNYTNLKQNQGFISLFTTYFLYLQHNLSGITTNQLNNFYLYLLKDEDGKPITFDQDKFDIRTIVSSKKNLQDDKAKKKKKPQEDQAKEAKGQKNEKQVFYMDTEMFKKVIIYEEAEKNLIQGGDEALQDGTSAAQQGNDEKGDKKKRPKPIQKASAASKMGQEKINAKSLKYMQYMNEFIELVMNDPVIENQEAVSLSKEVYQVNTKLAQAIQDILLAKFKEMVSNQDLHDSSRRILIDHLAHQLKIESKIVIGVIALLTQRNSMDEIQDLIYFIMKLNKINQEKFQVFYALFLLYTSTKKEDLFWALQELGINVKLIDLLLISKSIYDPYYMTQEMFNELEYLDINHYNQEEIDKIQDEASLSTLDLEEPHKTVMERLINQQTKRANMIQQIEKEKSEKIIGGRDSNYDNIQYECDKLLLLQIGGFKGGDSLPKDIEKIANPKNQLQNLNKKELEFIKNFIDLKSIIYQEKEIQQFNSEMRSSIEKLSQLMNITEKDLEMLITLILINQPDRFYTALDQFKIHHIKGLSKEDNLSGFVNFQVQLITNLYKKITLIESDKLNDLFDWDCPSELLIKLFLFRNKKLSLECQMALVESILYKDEDPASLKKLQSGKSLVLAENDVSPEELLTRKEAGYCLRPFLDFINQMVDYGDTQRVRQLLIKNKKENEISSVNDALMIIKMMGENNQEHSISAFLQHLYDSSRKNFSDSQPISPVFLHFASLYTIFVGKSARIFISVNEIDINPNSGTPFKRVEVKLSKYISAALDIPQEFFNTIYAYFMKDTMHFSNQSIMFFRKLTQQKLESKTKNLNIPIQSLINIPPKVIENVIGLLHTKDYNSAFFSKEIQLPIHIVDFTSIISKLKKLQNKDRPKQLKQLTKHPSCIRTLKSLKIEPKDLKYIFTMMYECLEKEDLKDLLKWLRFSGQEEIAEGLLQLDKNLPISNKVLGQKQLVDLEQNIIINKMKDLECNDKDNMAWIKISKCLLQGDFTYLPSIIDNHLKYLKFIHKFGKNENNYKQYLQGICGCISARYSEIDIKSFLFKSYHAIKQTMIDDKEDWVNPQNNPIPPSNTKEFAMYLLVKQAQLNPIWLGIFQQDFDIWEYIMDVYDTQFGRKNKYFDPSLLYYIMLIWLDMPVLVKEFITEGEFFTLLDKLYKDKYIKDFAIDLKKEPQNVTDGRFDKPCIQKYGNYEYQYTDFASENFKNEEEYIEIVFNLFCQNKREVEYQNIASNYDLQSYDLPNLVQLMDAAKLEAFKLNEKSQAYTNPQTREQLRQEAIMHNKKDVFEQQEKAQEKLIESLKQNREEINYGHERKVMKLEADLSEKRKKFLQGSQEKLKRETDLKDATILLLAFDYLKEHIEYENNLKQEEQDLINQKYDLEESFANNYDERKTFYHDNEEYMDGKIKENEELLAQLNQKIELQLKYEYKPSQGRLNKKQFLEDLIEEQKQTKQTMKNNFDQCNNLYKQCQNNLNQFEKDYDTIEADKQKLNVKRVEVDKQKAEIESLIQKFKEAAQSATEKENEKKEMIEKFEQEKQTKSSQIDDTKYDIRQKYEQKQSDFQSEHAQQIAEILSKIEEEKQQNEERKSQEGSQRGSQRSSQRKIFDPVQSGSKPLGLQMVQASNISKSQQPKKDLIMEHFVKMKQKFCDNQNLMAPSDQSTEDWKNGSAILDIILEQIKKDTEAALDKAEDDAADQAKQATKEFNEKIDPLGNAIEKLLQQKTTIQQQIKTKATKFCEESSDLLGDFNFVAFTKNNSDIQHMENMISDEEGNKVYYLDQAESYEYTMNQYQTYKTRYEEDAYNYYDIAERMKNEMDNVEEYLDQQKQQIDDKLSSTFQRFDQYLACQKEYNKEKAKDNDNKLKILWEVIQVQDMKARKYVGSKNIGTKDKPKEQAIYIKLTSTTNPKKEEIMDLFKEFYYFFDSDKLPEQNRVFSVRVRNKYFQPYFLSMMFKDIRDNHEYFEEKHLTTTNLRSFIEFSKKSALKSYKKVRVKVFEKLLTDNKKLFIGRLDENINRKRQELVDKYEKELIVVKKEQKRKQQEEEEEQKRKSEREVNLLEEASQQSIKSQKSQKNVDEEKKDDGSQKQQLKQSMKSPPPLTDLLEIQEKIKPTAEEKKIMEAHDDSILFEHEADDVKGEIKISKMEKKDSDGTAQVYYQVYKIVKSDEEKKLEAEKEAEKVAQQAAQLLLQRERDPLTPEEKEDIQMRVNEEMEEIIQKNENNQYKDDSAYINILKIFKRIAENYEKGQQRQPFKQFWTEIEQQASVQDRLGNLIVNKTHLQNLLICVN